MDRAICSGSDARFVGMHRWRAGALVAAALLAPVAASGLLASPAAAQTTSIAHSGSVDPYQGPSPNLTVTRPSSTQGVTPAMAPTGTSINGPRTSRNWSGYIDHSTTYNQISATWIVPTVSASSTAKYSSAWVGIDGYGNSDLIQTGTTQRTTGGVTHYTAWWEILPAAATTIADPVTPGDQMVGTIKKQTSGKWKITLKDQTKNWTFTQTFTYTGPAASAEVIMEAPKVATTITTLATYGRITFMSVSINTTGLPLNAATADYLVNTSFNILSAPGGNSGAAFSVVRGNPYVVPVIKSITPSSGSTAGGTSVKVKGTYLDTGLFTWVHFGTTAATSYSQTGTTIKAVAPAHAAGSVGVTIQTSDGLASTTAGKHTFTYMSPIPTISSISPDTGSKGGGRTVTITGTNFTGLTTVDFGANAATIVSHTSTTIHVKIPASTTAGLVRVKVTAAGGTSATTPTHDQFSYTSPVPLATYVTPNTGPTTGGTKVDITGNNLTGTTSVKFGTTPATITSVTTTKVVVITPAHAAGVVAVKVTTPVSTATATMNFTYGTTKPVLSSLTPGTGSTVGGRPVTLHGSNFTGVVSVTFGGAAATIVSHTTTTIDVRTPAHAAGTATVKVTNAAGSSSTLPFTYLAKAPTIVQVSPITGPAAGGARVYITGNYLTGTTSVKFGSTAATITSVSTTTVTVTAPAHAAGQVAITVANPDGSSVAATRYTYTMPAPVISSLSVTTGPAGGGQYVHIHGSNLSGATSVKFGSTSATITTDTATTLQVTTPHHAAGAVTVKVTTSGGTSGATTYTYMAPVITSVSPSSGPTVGGTGVTIQGRYLDGLSQIKFGTTTETGGFVGTTTHVFVTSPAHAAGTVTIEIIDGTPITTAIVWAHSTPTTADQFNYVTLAPTISGMTPTTGSTVGGQTVRITGTNFTGVTAVHFGATTATIVTHTATKVTVVAPAHATGTVRVKVTTPDGTSATTPAHDAFKFVHNPPTVQTSAPSTGPVAGGTKVTIRGRYFTGVSSVKFGAATAAITSKSPTQLVVTTPAHTAGAVVVTITTPDGTYTGGFTYVAAKPVVTSLTPKVGTTGGGTLVTVHGSQFTSLVGVSVGGSSATVISHTATLITMRTPAHVAATAVVVVTTAAGASAASAASTFTYRAPVITQVSPDVGPAQGGTSVTIIGEYFGGATQVLFGSTAGSNLVVTSTTQITVTSPPMSAGAVGIQVRTADAGSANTLYDVFIYQAPPLPTITNVSPPSGPTSGGTAVTISGSNFGTVTAVEFGAVPAASFHATGSSVVAVSPAESAGTVNIRVTNANGVSAWVQADRFTFDTPAPPPTPTQGYRLLGADGGLFSYGNATFHGSMGGKPLNAPIVGMANDQTTGGYWEVAADGGIFSFTAPFYGSMGGHPLNKPIVGMAATADDKGYWLVASDGGIFAFGDAGFYGSMGGQPLNKPIVGMAPTRDGRGYWMVASDGGIFSFGDATFHGSMGGQPLNEPIVSMALDLATGGYWLVASDGGLFAFTAPFFGSEGGHSIGTSVVGLVATSTGGGYWEAGANGAIYSFGDATTYGSMKGTSLNAPILGIAS